MEFWQSARGKTRAELQAGIDQNTAEQVRAGCAAAAAAALHHKLLLLLNTCSAARAGCQDGSLGLEPPGAPRCCKLRPFVPRLTVWLQMAARRTLPDARSLLEASLVQVSCCELLCLIALPALRLTC